MHSLRKTITPGVTQGRGDLKKKKKNGKKSPRGDLPKSTTTHTPNTHFTHIAAPTMSGLNSICEIQFKRHKDSSWGSLRPASVSCDDTSSDNNGKGKRGREYPQPSFTLRRIRGPTGRCSYEMRQKLAVLEYTFAFHTADCTYEGAPPLPANARTFPIFIQFLCNTKSNNQYNSKQLTIAGRKTAIFLCSSRGRAFFLRKKIPPGLTQREGGSFFFKIPPG